MMKVFIASGIDFAGIICLTTISSAPLLKGIGCGRLSTISSITY
jgi:hypothetical protein